LPYHFNQLSIFLENSVYKIIENLFIKVLVKIFIMVWFNDFMKYVITGGPCSGKTSVIEVLETKGYRVIEEAA